MAIISNKYVVPHTILQVESKKVPFVTKEFLNDILKNQSLNPGVTRNNYYIINTGEEMRSYKEDTKEARSFEIFMSIARMKGYSSVMLKF